MSAYHWQSRRATINLSKQLEANGEQDNTKQVALALRCQTTADRGFYRALNELRKAQKERRMTDRPIHLHTSDISEQAETKAAPQPTPSSTHEEIGLVPQNPEAPACQQHNDAPEPAPPPTNQAKPAKFILEYQPSTPEQDRIRAENYAARKK